MKRPTGRFFMQFYFRISLSRIFTSFIFHLKMLLSANIESPLGNMVAIASDQGICIFDFVDRKNLDNIIGRVTKSLNVAMNEGSHAIFDHLQRQIDEYFIGERFDFDLPMQPTGSPFQLSVWGTLMQIPFGETRSYKLQSKLLGDEKAVRAVANANGANGIAILIPCHRVIGTNGSLTGYGGGLWRKKWLLEHEAKYAGHLNRQGNLYEVD